MFFENCQGKISMIGICVNINTFFIKNCHFVHLVLVYIFNGDLKIFMTNINFFGRSFSLSFFLLNYVFRVYQRKVHLAVIELKQRSSFYKQAVLKKIFSTKHVVKSTIDMFIIHYVFLKINITRHLSKSGN